MKQKFRKKPVVIEAVQFTGGNQSEIISFAGKVAKMEGTLKHLIIKTLEGRMSVTAGDWVIKGVKGEYYPCKPDIFEATYEAI